MLQRFVAPGWSQAGFSQSLVQLTLSIIAAKPLACTISFFYVFRRHSLNFLSLSSTLRPSISKPKN